MEGLTRLVSESLARHGFERPLDYRRLQWSRWFRCDSHHSLLLVPSRPGVFALAEEVMGLGGTTNREGHGFSRADNSAQQTAAVAAEGSQAVSGVHLKPEAQSLSQEAESRKAEAGFPRRMLAVTQFFEADDMAFILDRMLSRHHPMRSRLESGRYFVRFVVIQDESQRRSIANALNQWMLSTAEKATGIGSHFANSLELTPATEFVPQANDSQAKLFGDSIVKPTLPSATSPETTKIDPAIAARKLCPETAGRIQSPPFPSGF